MTLVMWLVCRGDWPTQMTINAISTVVIQTCVCFFLKVK